MVPDTNDPALFPNAVFCLTCTQSWVVLCDNFAPARQVPGRLIPALPPTILTRSSQRTVLLRAAATNKVGPLLNVTVKRQTYGATVMDGS